MNKKKILICILVLVVLAAAVFVWRQCGSERTEPAENGGESVQAAPADGEPSQTGAEEQDKGNETETSGAVLMQDGGDIEIIIPDDEESDGF